MGTTAARITAQDFITPPELQCWKLANHAAGRIGGVRLELAGSLSGTFLTGCYQQVPLHVVSLSRSPPEQPALVYLLNPTAGLLDGDAQLISIQAAPQARALVVGQAATRIHPCWQGFSTQQWRIQVASGSVLVVLPGPAIPFQHCRSYQRVAIDLEAGAGFAWGDIWFAGRYARKNASEQFQFDVLIQELMVRREGQTVFRDRFCWKGPWGEREAAWHFGDAPAAGSLFLTGEFARPLPGKLDPCRWAAFITAAGDTCLRCTGTSEEVSSGIVRASLTAAALWTNPRAEKPWLLEGHELAPNHWFSQQ